MYKDISDYGLIGDMHSVALVSKDGSIDYCSMPHIDSPTVFAALLDDEKGGYFSIRPRQGFTSRQSYIADTNVLSCAFETAAGRARLMDFMPVVAEELFDKEEHIIHRCLKVTSGRMEFKLEFYPRPQYALGIPRIKRDGDIFRVGLNNEIFTLAVNAKEYTLKEANAGGLSIYISLKKNEDAHFDFIYGRRESKEIKACGFGQTCKFWSEWVHNCVAESCPLLGEYTAMVNRSLLVLKLLTFQPTGAIAAAATTSLPEAIGGERNWDYRFTWIRDASFTLKAMFAMGHITEADSFIKWLHSTYKRYGSSSLQIMYSLEGERDLGERELRHLKGYKGSRPVRAGNDAYRQKQWDIYGEVMDAALRLSDYAGRIDESLWPFFRDICNLACRNWRRPDDGMWEVRNGPFQFVYSKVMCWVAVDRGIKIARRYGFDAPIEKWQRERDEIKREVLEKGYDEALGSFLQRYGSKDPDSSLLLLPLMNFLPEDDRRIQGTIDACKRELMKEGFLLRYASADGLRGGEGAFILSNFWLIELLAVSGKVTEAKEFLSKTSAAANHLGLFSEEYDYRNRKMLGNFPQAFSHIGYINSVAAILNTQKVHFKNAGLNSTLIKRMKKLVPVKVVLNRIDVRRNDASRDLAKELKVALNNLQGAFFDVSMGRVDYGALRSSDSYKKYLELAGHLNAFDVFSLKREDEKKAFWINIYNILIIHGVIELEIRTSVKEVVNFFGRIGYNIGGFYFTPNDIEHGILRSNRFHPWGGRRLFSLFDRRRALSLRRLDPRIHFALVCGSSSCPPIEFYDARKIDEQLEIAGRSFINRNGLSFDKEKNIIRLSQIFKWYASDFGRSQKDVVRYALGFADEAAAKYLLDRIDGLGIEYLPYDWQLNKSLA